MRGGGATVAGVADGLEIPVFPSEGVKRRETADWVRSREIDLLLNVHSLYLIHADVARAPRIGSFNLHPGPLPERAGLNAPSWAIYRGDPYHGVTVHWMDGEIDTGAIAYESRFPIGDDETGLSLSIRCVREGLPLLQRLLEDAARDAAAIPAQAQDRSKRRYFGGAIPQAGRLVWTRSAREIVAFVPRVRLLPVPIAVGTPCCRGRWSIDLRPEGHTHREVDERTPRHGRRGRRVRSACCRP